MKFKLQQGAALGWAEHCRSSRAGISRTLLTTNEGLVFGVMPTVHYKRATRLCTLFAEMLFTLSLESCRKRPMRASAATPCVQEDHEESGLPERDGAPLRRDRGSAGYLSAGSKRSSALERTVVVLCLGVCFGRTFSFGGILHLVS